MKNAIVLVALSLSVSLRAMGEVKCESRISGEDLRAELHRMYQALREGLDAESAKAEGWLLDHIEDWPMAQQRDEILDSSIADPRLFIREMEHAFSFNLRQEALERLMPIMRAVATQIDDRAARRLIQTRFETLYLKAPPGSLLRRRAFDNLFGLFHRTQADWNPAFELALLKDAMEEVSVRSLLLLGLGETAEGEAFLREHSDHDDRSVALFANAALARRGDKEAERRVITKAQNHMRRMTDGQVELFFMSDLGDNLKCDSVEFWEQQAALRFIGTAATLIVRWEQLMADIPLHKPRGRLTAPLWSTVLRGIRMHLDMIGSENPDVPGWLSREDLDRWWAEHKDELHKILERHDPLYRHRHRLNYPGRPSWRHLPEPGGGR